MFYLPTGVPSQRPPESLELNKDKQLPGYTSEQGRRVTVDGAAYTKQVPPPLGRGKCNIASQPNIAASLNPAGEAKLMLLR